MHYFLRVKLTEANVLLNQTVPLENAVECPR